MPPSQIGRYGAVGFEFVASVGVGFFVGRVIDTHYDTHGVAMGIGFFLGVLGGFSLLVRTARALENEAAHDVDAAEPERDLRKRQPASAPDPVTAKLEDVEKKIADDDADR